MKEELTNVKSKNITLVLTHQCNIRCVYCYEKNKDETVMPLSLAKEIIDKELSADDGTDYVEFDLFGGEPMMEYDTVKEIINFVRQKEYKKQFIFFITTNGILFDEERKKWLAENVDLLQLGLSLDGNKAMHDLNRCNTFDRIDLDFFKNTYPTQPVKMTISEKTLPMLAEGVIFCHNKGFEVNCNLAYGLNWSDPKNRTVFEEQLIQLIDFYIENPQIKPCSMLEMTRLKSMTYLGDKNVRYCGAGYAMKAYDCDGTFYPCQHFLPLSIGKEKAKESLDIDFSDYYLENEKIAEKCLKCVIRNVCPTCYGENFSATGDIHKRDENMCIMFQIQFKALSYFVGKAFSCGLMKDMPDAETAAILKSALLINDGVNY